MCSWSAGPSGGRICALPVGCSYTPVPRSLVSCRSSSSIRILFPRANSPSPWRAHPDAVGSSESWKGLRAWKPMCTFSSDCNACECEGSGRFLASAFACALCICLALLPVSDAVAVESKNERASKQFESSVPSETFENVPQTLSGADKARRIQRPKSAQAESCTRKCVSTCIRGGAGAPGEGPLNVRRPLVVFKEGFRSRQYCLLECSEICNLIPDGQDGP